MLNINFVWENTRTKEKKYYIFITKFIDNTFFIVYMALERKIGSSIKYKIDLYTFVCYGI